ncbi:MAG TPA: transaldolase [Ignavibacteriaceae bacterium]|nr:transaldolase [Ignavibacteriaceae bacterium]
MNPVLSLEKYGQSVWLDNINRSLIKSGELKNLIKEIGLKGVTSNPSIFQKAVSSGKDYDPQVKSLLAKNPEMTPAELFEELAVKDIQDATDILSGVYKKTNGIDGYVSIEVSPELAYDTNATIEEARRLNKKAGRPNVMIKIPATQEGIPAIKKMISEGVNINVTLIFSPKVYEQVVDAYLSGLEERLAAGKKIDTIASVASFFISRIDSMVDKELDKVENKDLKGKIAVANAKLVYRKGKELFTSERFKKLQKKGAKIQRLLWASTSTKNPAYPDVLYVEELIGKNTINTLPPATIDAYKDHGKPADRIESGLKEAADQMKKLKDLKIDFEEVTKRLTEEGVVLFVNSYKDLIGAISKKKESTQLETA